MSKQTGPSLCSESQVCRGHAPRYSSDAAAELRRVLHAARHVAAESLGPVFSCRSHEDLLPMLLAGGISPDRSLDFSTFHTALLWAGGSLACVGMPQLGCFRAHTVRVSCVNCAQTYKLSICAWCVAGTQIAQQETNTRGPGKEARERESERER